MASKSLGTLTLDLVAKTAGFVQGMDKAERASQKWRRQVQRDLQQVSRAMGRGLSIGAAAAAAGITVLVARSRELIDAQAKTAQQLRTTSASIANLTRAGDLAGVSLKQIEVAGRTLDVSLGRAAQGVGAQADAIDALGLKVEDLISLPLDQRFLAINRALREQIPLTERAAIAADLFGTRNAAAIQQLQPEVIAQATREIGVFGLAISDIDAAKIEAANDSFSRLGLAAKGIGTQLTIALAPALEAIGEIFFNYAEDAGGANQLVSDSFDSVINAIAFTVDAADSIGRAFRTVADLSIAAISKLAQETAESIASLLDFVDDLPLLNFEDQVTGLRDFAAVQGGIVDEAFANIRRNIETPLAGNALRDAYQAAKLSAEEAAQAAVAAREAAGAEGAGVTRENTALLEEIKITAQKRKTSDEVQDIIDKTEAYVDLVKSLRTDDERRTATLREQLAIVAAVNLAEEERAETRRRIIANSLPDLPEVEGLAPVVGGALSEAMRLQSGQEELDAALAAAQETLKTRLDERLITEAEYYAASQELAQQHAARLGEIDEARQVLAYQNTELLFGNLAGLAKQFAGEQSGIYKALFAVEKAAAIARSIVAIQTGIAQAAAQPFPANLAAIASVASATAGIISTITSTTLQGQAHDGMDRVPRTGTYLLEQGERVTTAETSQKLDRTLSTVQRGMDAGNNGSSTALRIVNAFDTGVISDYMGSSDGEEVIMNVVRRNQRTIRALTT